MENGYASIDAALRALYPGQAFVAGARLEPGERSHLKEIRVYAHPRGHWHYVTLGFSELGDKISTDTVRSGWGFELTMRVAGTVDERPPRWPVRALHELARYVFESKAPLAAGHHMDLGGPVDDAALAITGFAFALEPELASLRTPNGLVAFVLVIGVRTDEEAIMARWSVRSFAEILEQRTPLLVTRPERPSLLDDPELGPVIRKRVDEEGSGQAAAAAEVLSWRIPWWSPRTLEISIGPASIARRHLSTMLGACVQHDTPFRIVSGSRELRIKPGEAARWDVDGGVLRMTAPPLFAAELKAFVDGRDLRFESAIVRGLTVKLVD